MKSLTGTVDVVISGAGLAGASLACRLARTGARVMVLDPSTFPRPKLCGEFLSPEAWGALDQLGVAEEIKGVGFQPIHRARLTTPRGRVLVSELIGKDGKPGLGLSRSMLDDLLVRQARSAGAEVVERARVSGPVIEEGRVVGLMARHPEAGSFVVRASVVIAADGRHSALVRRTGHTWGRSWFRRRLFGFKRHLTVADGAAAEPIGSVGLHLIPGGYIGTCRVEGGLTNLCGLLPEAIVKRYRGDLDQLAAVEFERNPLLARLWAAATLTGPWKSVAGVRVEMSSPRLPGILYAGDCQGTVDPLGGQGMTMALLGTEELLPFIKQSLVAGTADRAIQRSHSLAWHRRFDRRIRLCRLFHHVLLHPALLDMASSLPGLSSRLLMAGYSWTRDPVTLAQPA